MLSLKLTTVALLTSFVLSGAMPLAWHLLRPVILLPTEAAAWPPERLRAVLLHELAHIARHDCWTLAMAELALALSLAKRMREVLCALPALLSWQWLEMRRLRGAAGGQPE